MVPTSLHSTTAKPFSSHGGARKWWRAPPVMVVWGWRHLLDAYWIELSPFDLLECCLLYSTAAWCSVPGLPNGFPLAPSHDGRWAGINIIFYIWPSLTVNITQDKQLVHDSSRHTNAEIQVAMDWIHSWCSQGSIPLSKVNLKYVYFHRYDIKSHCYISITHASYSHNTRSPMTTKHL